ncbi:MAG: Bifunctional uridylyltransferase/uridylyl-removing enzyme [Gammaproteobacteria bacterium]|nr:Bifunctional uridylyltransferase/uridylyl-removing enzyme [Gammaproteobacteria bacterium]
MSATPVAEPVDQRTAVTTESIALFKRRLTEGRGRLRQDFEAGAPVESLVRQMAGLVDEVLVEAWRANGLPETGLALAAVGGYGRGELHPGSDVDIAVVLAEGADRGMSQRLEQFVTFLWDIGLEVGHSVRTVAECRDEAERDVTVVTNLMEARLLAGDPDLFEEMRRVTGPQSIWPTAAFFEAKLAEQIARHHRHHDSAQRLEPHIKEAPGGLRDIQVIGWVAKRHFGAETLRELVRHGFLTEEEFKTLDAGQNLLWRIRFGLHLLAGRREDRLLFDYQRAIAEQFGFRDGANNRGVEQFMKMYYRTALELQRLNEMLLELFAEAILESDRPAEVIALNSRFQVRNGYIEATSRQVFSRYRFAMLEIFLLLQRNPSIQGVRASTIRLIRDHRHLIDENFRADLRNRSLFMEIIRQPRRIGHELARMHRYGVLEAYLPVFGKIVGLMQFDLFHVYTVDEHTLTVVRNLRQFLTPERDDDLPLCREIMSQLPKPELLYLAGLFHDIAKGRNGDHSELGEQEAVTFCEQHGLSQYDTRLVGWLVRNHLLMSRTATRMDVSDPDVVNNFAGILGDRTHLDYLYLLTVADIRGTNITLWTSWKDALLRELYRGTLGALRRGLENPIQRRERVMEAQGEALAMLCRKSLTKDAVLGQWNALGEDYFLRHTPEEIAWHTEVILGHGENPAPLVLLRPNPRRGGTEIFVYARDQDFLFAVSTHTLDQLGLTVHDARIITSENGYTLDTYIVLDADSGKPIERGYRADEIVSTIERNISARTLPATQFRRPSRKLRSFSVPTRITFSDDKASKRTIMEVITTDRPGVLARIAQGMRFCRVRLQNARIATFGERVEDLFFLTDMEGRPLRDEVTFECLRRSITETLAQD